MSIAWRGATRYLILAGIMLTPFLPLVFTSSLFFPYITGKAFAFRILVTMLLGLWLILLAVNRESRAVLSARFSRRSVITWAVLAFLLITTLATIFGVNPYRSFWSNFERMEGLITYLHLGLFFLITTTVLNSDKLWRAFFNISIAVSLIVVWLGFSELLPSLKIGGSIRIATTFGNPTYLAVYLLIHIFLTAYLLVRKNTPQWLRYLYGVIIVLQALILYFTATRGAILGLIGGAFVAFVLAFWSYRAVPWVRHLAFVGVAIVLILVGGFWLARDTAFVRESSVLARFADISLAEQTTESRLVVWQMALRGAKERPILGWGPENFNLVFNKYYEPQLYRQESWFDRSHNIFMDWLINAGILGLLSYLSLFAVALLIIWRSRSISPAGKSILVGLLVAYGFHNIFVFDNLISYILFFSLLAYLNYRDTSLELELPPSSLSKKQAKRERNQGEGVSPGLIWGSVGLGVMIIFVGVYYFNLRPLQSGQELIRALSPSETLVGRQELFAGIVDRQTFLTTEAREYAINQTPNWLRSGADLTGAQEWINFAVASAESLARDNSLDARSQLFAGMLFMNLGRAEEGLPYLERALELSPRKQTIMMQVAISHSSLGDNERALELAERAFRLDENFAEARRVYGLLLIHNAEHGDDFVLADQIVNAVDDNGEFLLAPDNSILNAYVAKGRYEEVLKLWQRKVAGDESNRQYRLSLAATYVMIGNRAEAVRELEVVARMFPEVKDETDYLIREILAGRNPIKF